MSRPCAETSGESICSHQNTIDNVRDGEATCLECGKVVEQLFGLADDFCAKDDDLHESEIHYWIKDVCFNACIPNNVISAAENKYKKLREGLRGNKFKCKTLAAYAVYQTLIKFGTPRLVEEIAFYTGISSKEIWRVESIVISQGVMNLSTYYCSRYCSLLQLSHTDSMQVENLVTLIEDDLPVGSVRCNCIVAVVLYLFCKEEKKKISLTKICGTCAISSTSVHRIIRMLREDCREKIEQNPQLCWILKHL
jgi:transcription initiation factor TFIIIB Brf1 subunit/transcription initiation factor TFIIB